MCVWWRRDEESQSYGNAELSKTNKIDGVRGAHHDRGSEPSLSLIAAGFYATICTKALRVASGSNSMCQWSKPKGAINNTKYW